MTTYRVCCCFRRQFQPASDDPPESIKALFRQYSDNGLMGPVHLQRFLAEVQGEPNSTVEMAQRVLESKREFKHLNVLKKKGLNLDAFFRYLYNDANPALDPALGVR